MVARFIFVLARWGLLCIMAVPLAACAAPRPVVPSNPRQGAQSPMGCPVEWSAIIEGDNPHPYGQLAVTLVATVALRKYGVEKLTDEDWKPFEQPFSVTLVLPEGVTLLKGELTYPRVALKPSADWTQQLILEVRDLKTEGARIQTHFYWASRDILCDTRLRFKFRGQDQDGFAIYLRPNVKEGFDATWDDPWFGATPTSPPGTGYVGLHTPIPPQAIQPIQDHSQTISWPFGCPVQWSAIIDGDNPHPYGPVTVTLIATVAEGMRSMSDEQWTAFVSPFSVTLDIPEGVTLIKGDASYPSVAIRPNTQWKQQLVFDVRKLNPSNSRVSTNYYLRAVRDGYVCDTRLESKYSGEPKEGIGIYLRPNPQGGVDIAWDDPWFGVTPTPPANMTPFASQNTQTKP